MLMPETMPVVPAGDYPNNLGFLPEVSPRALTSPIVTA